MSFFYNPAKAEPRKPKVIKLADIPITSLRKMGCEACPRDADSDRLHSPKMRPSGPKTAPMYLLGTSPSAEDDEDDVHWSDKAGAEIVKKFGSDFMADNVRSNYLTQCRGDQTAIEVECCRDRVVADIEAVRPKVIVGVGDPPLYWATHIKNGGAIPHRGTLFVVRVGKHVCYYYQLLYPNYVHRKGGYGVNPFELSLKHDIRKVKDMLLDGWFDKNPPRIYDAPYDKGIEIITGNEPGDMQRLEAALARITRYPRSTIDIETTGLRPYMMRNPEIVTAAVGTFDDTVAFSLDHPEGWGSLAQRLRAWALFFDFCVATGRMAAHNAAFEMEWLAHKFGRKFLMRVEWDDTMALAHTLDQRGGTKGLDKQTIIHFGFDLKEQSTVNVKLKDWWLLFPLREILRYNGMDTKWSDLLRSTLMPRVQAVPELAAEYARNIRLAPALVIMETKGLPVDLEYAHDISDRFDKELEILEGKISRTPEVKEYERRIGRFSPTNPDHVLQLMKDVLDRPEIRVSDKDGERDTTGKDALDLMPKDEVPSAALILQHRVIAKLLSTYVVPVTSKKIVCPDGRLRPKYSQMVAITGRLAAEDPNIQNWPARQHKEVRGIVASKDTIVACDYGQIEFRVVGMASEDRNVVKYCWTGYDVHKYWAERMIREYGPVVDWIVNEFEDSLAAIKKKEGRDYDEDAAILKTLRQEAKNGWVFPQLFGSTTRSCADRLHLPEDVADELGKEFWDEFKGVKKWQEKIMRDYEKNLYVETLGGRQRRGPMTRNEAINHPIQGTAFDIVTRSQVELTEQSIVDEDADLCPNLNVHDDLTFEIPDAVVQPKLDIIVPAMCMPRFDYINVPLIVEVKTGKRWHDLKEIGVYKSHELFGHRNPYI